MNYILTIENLIKAHRDAYAIIKNIQPEAQVGMATHNVYLEAYKNRFHNAFIKKIGDWWINFYFLDMIKNHQDFIGLNHYFHNRINYGFNKNENRRTSDMGWELYPQAIYHVLMYLKRYKRPVYVT